MNNYKNLIAILRDCANPNFSCRYCKLFGDERCKENISAQAADAICELLRIGSKMHTWIFLHTTDEQAAYDEIGLTPEQNAMFGYSGQMILKAEPPKGVE